MSEPTVLARRATSAPWGWCAASLLVWAALLGMVLTGKGLAEDDGPVLAWVVGHRSGVLTTFFTAVSSTALDGGAAVLAAVIVVLVAVGPARRSRC